MNRIYWIPGLTHGKLGMMARPRGHDWLEDEINHLRFHQVDTLVSLLERSEIIELGLQNEENLCQDYQINFIPFPIQDRGLPIHGNHFIDLAKKLGHRLTEGKNVTIHCRMGIGRTSLLCAAILVSLGHNPFGIFELLSEVRTLEVPDTDEQKNWLFELSDRLK